MAGYGVGEVIQSILQRRREDARQGMLDQLEREFRTSQMDATKHGLELEADRNRLEGRRVATDEAQSGQQMAESRERVLRSKQESLPYQGTQLANIKDNDLKQFLMDRMQVDTIQPMGPTEDGSNLPSFQWYKGSPEYQKEQFNQERIQGLPETPGWRDLASAGINPSGMLPSPRTPLTTVTAGGGVRVHPNTLVPENQSVVELPWQPASYGGGASGSLPRAARMVHSATGQEMPITGTSAELMLQINQMEAQGWQFGGFIGSSATGGAAGATSPAVQKALSDAKSAWLALENDRYNKAWGSWVSDPGLAEQRSKQQYESLRDQQFRVDPAPEDIKQLARDIAGTRELRGLNVQAIMESLEPEDAAQLDELDKQHLQRLLSF